MTLVGMSLGAVLGVATVTTAAVVAAYLLRRQARPQVVSNVDFWRRAIERSRARTLLATRIPWIPMLVSLAIALLMVLHIGDPRPGLGIVRATVIVLDADRTMGAVDPHGRTRLEDALAIVRDLVRTDTRPGQIAIIRAGVASEVVVPFTEKPSDAAALLARRDTDDGPADLRHAIALAQSMVVSARSAGRVVLVADRAAEGFTADPRAPVVLASVGAPSETIAVTALDARRDPFALGEYAVRCEVRSYSEHVPSARLVIRDRGVVLSDQQIALAPGEISVHQAHGFSSGQAEIVAQLEDLAIDGGHDALASDDVAYATVPPAVATNVLLVTPGNRYLENALAADPSLHLETVDLAGLAARRVAQGGLAHYQVVVLDRVAPQAEVDHPAMLLFGAPDTRLAHVGADIERPRVTAFAADHRALEGLRFDQVRIAHSRRLYPEPDERVLVRSGSDVLAVARDRNGVRRLTFGFDTDGTDLARRVAFPLLVHNAIAWLDRRDEDFRSWQTPGSAIAVPGVSGLVLLPNGAAQEAHGTDFQTARAGTYHTADRAISISAADEAGTLLEPAASSSFHLGRSGSRLPIATIIAALILLLICVEWLATQRGRLT